MPPAHRGIASAIPISNLLLLSICRNNLLSSNNKTCVVSLHEPFRDSKDDLPTETNLLSPLLTLSIKPDAPPMVKTRSSNLSLCPDVSEGGESAKLLKE